MDLSKLLRMRKLTRVVEEHFRNQLSAHLISLQPLFKPANVLGEYIRNAPKGTLKVADASLKELRSMYARIGRVSPFRFEDEIKPPLDIFGSAVDITPITYEYKPGNSGDAQVIKVTSPLKWVLSYKGLGPSRLQELLVSQSGTARLELQACLLHYLVLHIILSQDPGVTGILRALRFTVSTEPAETFGGLPITRIAAPVRTILPHDAVIIQSTELSGASTFEEIIDIASIAQLRDPVKETLLDLVGDSGDDLLIADAADRDS